MRGIRNYIIFTGFLLMILLVGFMYYYLTLAGKNPITRGTLVENNSIVRDIPA